MSLHENVISGQKEEGKAGGNFFENASKEDLIKQVKKYAGLLHKTKNKCDEIKEKYTKLEVEMTRLKENSEHNDDADNKIDGTIRKYNEANEEIECMRMKENTLKITIHALQEEISQLTNDNQNLKCTETELALLKEEKMKLGNQNEILRIEIEKLTAELTQKEDENKLTNLENENLKKNLDLEIKSKTEEINNLIADKTELKDAMNKLLEEKNFLKDSLEDLSENQPKDEDLDEVLMQLDQVQNDNILLRAELENASTERDRLLFQEQREESCSNLDHIQKLESELYDWKNKLESAEFEVEELRAKLEDANDNQDLKLELENYKEKENLLMNILRDEFELTENEVENMLNTLKVKFSELYTEVDKLSFQLEDKDVEILEMREKFSNFQNYNEIKFENENLKVDFESLRNEFEALKQVDVKHEEELAMYEKEVNRLQLDIENGKKLLDKHVEILSVNDNKYKEMVEENAKLKNDVETAKKSFEYEKSEREKEMECLKRDLEITSETNIKQDEILELQKEIDKLKTELESKLKTFEITKTQLENEIEILNKELDNKCDIISHHESLQKNTALDRDDEILDMQRKLCNVMEENTRLIAELNITSKTFEIEKSRLENEIIFTKKELESKIGALTQLESLMNSNDDDNKNEVLDLRAKLQAFEDEHNRLNAELDNKEKEKSLLEKEIECVTKDLTNKNETFSHQEILMNEQIGGLNREICNLQERLAVLEEENECLLQRPSVDEFNKMMQARDEIIDRETQITQNIKTELDKTLMDLATTNSQLVALKAEVDLNKTDANATKETMNELNAKVTVLKYENEKLKSKNNELSIEVKGHIESNNLISKQFEQEKELHTKTTTQLESMQLQIKQQKLVNLEFADYERLVSDLNQQIDKSNDDKDKLKEEIKQNEEMLDGVKVQLNQAESQRKQHEERCAKMKILLVKTKRELAELRKSNNVQNQIELEMKSEMEICRNKMESMQIELSQAISQSKKLQETLAATKESHQRVVSALETRINALQQDLEISYREYKECKTEFDGYKVRVHSVLKQQKEKSSANVQQEVDISEKEYLEKALEQLKLKLEETNEHTMALEMEKNTLQDERDRLFNKYEKTVTEMQQNEKEFNEKLDNLYSEEATLKHKHSEALQQLRFQNEVIIETYKEQIRTLKEENDKNVADLRAKLSTAEFEANKNHHHYHLQKQINRDENDVFDISNMERQEGEGSENTEHNSSTPIQYNYDNLSTEFSLEQLLNSKTSTTNLTLPNDEFESIEQRALSSAKKIDHLTELLNESEATNLRLTEQTKVLKEEIRRLERNQEREKHAANMEYLKNIVLKFLTLNEGDERERLVPVLTMMLKLSPEEKNQLHILAKRDIADAEGENGGWTNYLPRWSGLI